MLLCTSRFEVGRGLAEQFRFEFQFVLPVVFVATFEVTGESGRFGSVAIGKRRISSLVLIDLRQRQQIVIAVVQTDG